MAEVVGLDTSYDTWKFLTNTYHQRSQARIHSIRHQLNITKKGTLTIFDYLHQLKGMFDTLANIGVPLSDADKVHFFLASLGFFIKDRKTGQKPDDRS